MSAQAFHAILDVKKAILERDSHSVALIRQELSAAQSLKNGIEQRSGSPVDDLDTGGALQAAIRFEAAQKVRLVDLEKRIVEIEQRLGDAEEALKISLGENRAVERLM